jgi:hypothetical protein
LSPSERSTVEFRRVHGADQRLWRKWGPYLSDRSWGTVREDYSAKGEAWDHLPHELARSKAYRWGEDGIAGFSDRYQILCWSLALWNERDPILKERLFGLEPSEGNHGEDVKECYFHTDGTPSHSYMRMLYKYPQAEFPYAELIAENRRRGGKGPEYELIDTGLFDDHRYFDVEIEMAKEDPDAIIFKVTAHNRGPVAAPIHLIPHLWFRNTWGWGTQANVEPVITVDGSRPGTTALLADDSGAPPLHGLLADSRLGPHRLELPSGVDVFFTDNETNATEVYGPRARSRSRYVKDAFHRRVVNGELDAVNPQLRGTRACARQKFVVPAGGSVSMRMRLSPSAMAPMSGEQMDEVVRLRRSEADEFYDSMHPAKATPIERQIQRQAWAGMTWSKQSYLFDVGAWLDGDNDAMPPPAARKQGRNKHWRHLNSMRVLSMPDKWEYPWFAAWDLAFHMIPFARIDSEFAKEQLWLMLFEQFQHPNGQIPAYEWEFSDLNPPVQPWAVWRVYNMDRVQNGKGDLEFLERCFHKLMLNFTWWVNKVDREGNNVFEGGFLGLDNITVIDRSNPLPGGASLEQSDATGWMGMFSLVMMRMALELAKTKSAYEGLATKFFEHYVYIGAAMKMERLGRTLWDEEDGFFYDLLRFPDGRAIPFRVRSLVGLIPLFAIERLEEEWIKPFPTFTENFRWFMKFRPQITAQTVTTVAHGASTTHVLAVVDRHQLEKLLARVVDPAEFLSPCGVRSLSKFHEEHPFVFGNAVVSYEPAEAVSKLKGGNSNWRGPVWFPTSFLMIETFRKLERGFGSGITIGVTDHETKEHGQVTLTGLAKNLADRMISIFVPDAEGYRPCHGPKGSRRAELFAHDPHWKDLVLYYEYFHAETGEGLGASHQTGWTGLVASLIDEWRG